MIDISLDVVQYDCPFIDTTDEHDVAFSTVHWEFDAAAEELETRLVVEGGDRRTLDRSLDTLRRHPNMRECDLLRKREGTALIRTVIDQTNAMEVIRAHDGYITGPFHVEDGSELWEVGFDDRQVADDALSALDRHNEFTVVSETVLGIDELFDLIANAEAASELLAGCRDLSTVERETLTVAAERGYFEQPRDATLQSLAAEFDVSDTAVSKNLRRGERKVLGRVIRALETMG